MRMEGNPWRWLSRRPGWRKHPNELASSARAFCRISNEVVSPGKRNIVGNGPLGAASVSQSLSNDAHVAIPFDEVRFHFRRAFDKCLSAAGLSVNQFGLSDWWTF